jgi:serine/threonine-protein kinase
MDKTQPTPKRASRGSDRVIGLLVVLATLLVGALGGLREAELKTYQWGMRISPVRTPSDDVVLVTLDRPAAGEPAVTRRELAQVNRTISQGYPRSIAYVMPLHDPENGTALGVLEALQRSQGKRLGKKGVAVFERALRRLDTDTALASSFRTSGRVVLAVPADLGPAPGDPPVGLSPALRRSLIERADTAPPGTLTERLRRIMDPRLPAQLRRVRPPLELLARSAAASGFAPELGGRPQTLSAIPLVLAQGERYLPSVHLVLASRARELALDALKVEPGRGIRLGEELIPTDPALGVLPYFYRSEDGSPPFEVIPFRDVLDKRVPSWLFHAKTVLVGPAAPPWGAPSSAPLGEPLAPVMAAAHVVSSLINNDLYRVPGWSLWAMLGAVGLVACYLMFLLPRLRLSTGLVLSGLLLTLILNVQLISMVAESIWIPMLAPALALVVGHILLAGKRMMLNTVQVYQAQLSSANLLLGQAFQGQGQLDRAYARYRACVVDAELLDQLYHLGLDYERKRQFARAQEVFRHIHSHACDFKDVAERIERNRARMNALVISAGTRDGADGTLILGDDALQKPMLGRYRIEKQLGRGEMGVVYLGHDSKIGRTVAIKTMALANEFDEGRLPDVRERFLLEAATAGRLRHPNIVTIYDVGEDQGLTYIAMDYLSGSPMSAYTRPGQLLPVKEVLQVAIQVAAALDSAHKQNVVHRDIKPANIIYDRDTGVASVTDFGVACITDAVKTKSGMILGTPAFMSPEQLVGERVDGRTDIYSLGVTLYQLFTGELPFQADSISSLMYKIANEPPKSAAVRRPELPDCVSEVIAKALEKGPEARFQRGGLMASVLRRCLQRIDESCQDLYYATSDNKGRNGNKIMRQAYD